MILAVLSVMALIITWVAGLDKPVSGLLLFWIIAAPCNVINSWLKFRYEQRMRYAVFKGRYY